MKEREYKRMEKKKNDYRFTNFVKLSKYVYYITITVDVQRLIMNLKDFSYFAKLKLLAH